YTPVLSSISGRILLRKKLYFREVNMEFTDPAVEQYLHSLLPARDTVLQEMETLAKKRKIPIIGPVVARILYQLVRLVKAKTIFELGSAIGYSTIWIARAAGEGA